MYALLTGTCAVDDDDIHEEEQLSESDDIEENGPAVNVKDEEDAMVAADGHIVIPNCCCAICHR